MLARIMTDSGTNLGQVARILANLGGEQSGDVINGENSASAVPRRENSSLY